MSEFKRNTLSEEAAKKTVNELQQRLVDTVDLALQLKQAHWNVVGTNFRTVHLQLDEILVDVREATDDIAERISTLGHAPDGRASTVAEQSTLEAYPQSFEKAQETISKIANRLETCITGLRKSIEPLGDIDPISEDLLIAITGGLEKHLWMVQAQEV